MTIEPDIPNAKTILREIMQTKGVSVDQAYEEALTKYGNQQIIFEEARMAIKQEDSSR